MKVYAVYVYHIYEPGGNFDLYDSIEKAEQAKVELVKSLIDKNERVVVVECEVK